MNGEGKTTSMERFTLQGGVTELAEKVSALSEIVDKTRKIRNFLESPEPMEEKDKEKRDDPDTPLKALKNHLDDLGDIIRTMNKNLNDTANNLGAE